MTRTFGDLGYSYRKTPRMSPNVRLPSHQTPDAYGKLNYCGMYSLVRKPCSRPQSTPSSPPPDNRLTVGRVSPFPSRYCLPRRATNLSRAPDSRGPAISPTSASRPHPLRLRRIEGSICQGNLVYYSGEFS